MSVLGMTLQPWSYKCSIYHYQNNNVTFFGSFFNTKDNKIDELLSILTGLAPRGLHANSIAFVPSVVVPSFPRSQHVLSA